MVLIQTKPNVGGMELFWLLRAKLRDPFEYQCFLAKGTFKISVFIKSNPSVRRAEPKTLVPESEHLLLGF